MGLVDTSFDAFTHRHALDPCLVVFRHDAGAPSDGPCAVLARGEQCGEGEAVKLLSSGKERERERETRTNRVRSIIHAFGNPAPSRHGVELNQQMRSW